MENKLELKHLAPYLPYGLKFIMTSDYLDEFDFNDWYGDEDDYKKGSIWTYAGEVDEDLNIPLGDGDISRVFRKESTYISIMCNGIKPILRPLSDLAKNEFPFKIGTYTKDFVFILENTEYQFVARMFELHFDVFRLIDKGLAIDINTLNK